MEYLKNDVELGISEIKNNLKAFRKEAAIVKKEILFGYISVSNGQKDLLLSLIKEVDKINHMNKATTKPEIGAASDEKPSKAQ
mmetsp:Transcript_12221/g.10522  ORF Transcript_12221/g.10522 Transcript_12221/m.10522 type:complete len:83 (+) Transcript_12221:2255-2503(+)